MEKPIKVTIIIISSYSGYYDAIALDVTERYKSTLSAKVDYVKNITQRFNFSIIVNLCIFGLNNFSTIAMMLKEFTWF